jgi:hypothetical protein
VLTITATCINDTHSALMAFTTITSITALIEGPSLSLAKTNRIPDHLKVFQCECLFSTQYSGANLASFVFVRY